MRDQVWIVIDICTCFAKDQVWIFIDICTCFAKDQVWIFIDIFTCFAKDEVWLFPFKFYLVDFNVKWVTKQKKPNGIYFTDGILMNGNFKFYTDN